MFRTWLKLINDFTVDKCYDECKIKIQSRRQRNMAISWCFHPCFFFSAVCMFRAFHAETTLRLELHSNAIRIRPHLRTCLDSHSGIVTGSPNFENWTECSLQVIWENIPAIKEIAHRDVEVAVATGKIARHITVARFASTAASLRVLKDWSDFDFTIYDHKNGEDNFRAEFGDAMNGKVVEQTNQCDEASVYLSRITSKYSDLADVEIFVHDHVVTPGLRNWIVANSENNLTYSSFSTGEHTVGFGLGKNLAVRTLYGMMKNGTYAPYTGILKYHPNGSFMVASRQIRSRPLKFWKFLHEISLNPILSNLNWTLRYPIRTCEELGEQQGCARTRRAYCMYSHAYERLWGVFMGQD